MKAFWTDLESRFLRLHDQQRQERQDSYVHAFYDGNKGTVSGSSENIRKQFEWLAQQAAVRLGFPAETDPVVSWLNLLKKESPHYKPLNTTGRRRKSELDTEEMCSWEYEISHLEGGSIDLLCRASAEYCVRCDTQEQAKRNANQRIAALRAKSARQEAPISELQALLLLERDKNSIPTRLRNRLNKVASRGSATASSSDSGKAPKSEAVEYGARGGRPRKNDERELIRKKREARKPWKTVADEMNAETGNERSVRAYQYLLRTESHRKKS
jgi:uncharacterized coiled-coil protein SlyX